MSTAASSSAGKSRALISVFDKDGVVFLGKQLEQLGELCMVGLLLSAAIAMPLAARRRKGEFQNGKQP